MPNPVRSQAPCPIPGCPEHITPDFVMCRRHWYMVPAEIRSRWWAARKALQRETLSGTTPETIKAHREAKAAAIEAATAADAAARLVYQAIKARLQAEAPALLKVLAIAPELEVSVKALLKVLAIAPELEIEPPKDKKSGKKYQAVPGMKKRIIEK